MALKYQALRMLTEPYATLAGRSFDSSGGGWGDGGFDTFDGWSGFKLTIGGQTVALATDAMMNDASGSITTRTITIGGVEVSVSSMWFNRDYFCLQCRYSGSAVLTFGGGLGSDGVGVHTKTGLIGSHGGAGDPRIWWRIVPLLADEVVDYTLTGSDPINISVTPMSEGFALLFGWAQVTHAAVEHTLSLAVKQVDTPAIVWLSHFDPIEAGIVFMPPIRMTIFPANQETRAQFQPQDIDWRGSPGFVYPGPMPSQPISAKQICQGQDKNWLRDGVRNVEQGYIESTVTISGVGVRRRVLCFTQSGELVGETWSRASDGKYRFDLLWLNRRYMLVAQDDPAFGPADYNAVAADYQLPVPYAPGQGVGLV